MQPLIKPTVRRHLRTCQDLVDTLSHKAAGFLYRTFQSFIQSTNTIRGSRPVCNPDWHAVQTWLSLRWASASNCPQPGCQRQPGSLTFFSGESQTKKPSFATVTFFCCHWPFPAEVRNKKVNLFKPQTWRFWFSWFFPFSFLYTCFFLGEPTVLPFHGFHTAVINSRYLHVLPQAVQHLIQQLLTKATALRRLWRPLVRRSNKKRGFLRHISLHQCVYLHIHLDLYIIIYFDMWLYSMHEKMQTNYNYNRVVDISIQTYCMSIHIIPTWFYSNLYFSGEYVQF